MVLRQLQWPHQLGRNKISMRLDRALCNESCNEMWESISCRTLARSSSDHHPILVLLQKNVKRFKSQFKFLDMWTMHPDCCTDCSMFVLGRKLQTTKRDLRCWNKHMLGNVHQRVLQAHSRLKNIQNSKASLEEETCAQIDLQLALKMEEAYWKEKAKLKWYIENDHKNA
ncbi:hypothetical protein Fmac_029037 [Flemingia macrophylla]|uniref:Uncharacterized protein n=1 Tax=Flemingia macrophylla TaxID=520843 RepID=A0ABD1L978_9FABA